MYNVHTEWQTFGQRKKIAVEEQVFAHFCDKKIIYFLVLLLALLHIDPDRLLLKALQMQALQNLGDFR